MVYGNHTDIPIDMITGDGHSINQVNFVALDVIDVAFIPSINDIQSEAGKLSCMYELDKYNGIIKPHKKVNVALIKSEKRGLIRILLSLILQENTQAVIIQKLSSHKRYSRLKYDSDISYKISRDTLNRRYCANYAYIPSLNYTEVFA